MAFLGVLLSLLFLQTLSSLELTGPSIHEARLGSDARVPCRFTVDKPPVDLNHLTIFWYYQNKEILSYDKTVRTTSPRYSLSPETLVTGVANLTISNVQIPDDGRYKCSGIYNSERKEKDVWLNVGAPPQVTITKKMTALNVKLDLLCSVTGFFPVSIDIKWLRNGENLENNIIVGDPRTNPDRTYSVDSTVTIAPTEEDVEDIFSCRVQHKYLHEPLQEDFRLMYEGQ